MNCVVINKDEYLENIDFYTDIISLFYDDINKDTILKNFEYGSLYCFVLDEKDNPASICRFTKAYNRETIYVIRQIDTLKEYQGRGFASLCLKSVEQYLSGIEKAKIIVSFVDDENQASINLHEKCGFNKAEKISGYLQMLYGWDSAYMFEKTIDKSFRYEKEGVV